jgi:hypothetical protein
MSGEESCAVCGRSILAGERVRGYVSDGGGRSVCTLCEAAAERLGWRLEEGVQEQPPTEAQGGRRRGLVGLLRRRARGAPAAEPEESPTRVPEDDPAAAGMRSEGTREEPSSLTPFERAAARFNASEAGRTVAGLARTLGPPQVSLGASAGTPSEVRITVAWELSWYQWGVDLRDELRPVFQLDKGHEISQLDAPARQWNATVVDGGRIVIEAPTADRASGEPAHR